MSLEKARAWLERYGMAERILTFEASSATVELAAEALHCEPGRIAKTLSFVVNDQVILLVTAGDVRIDNAKYKAQFGTKAKMVSAEEAEQLIGHAVGGVCPFGVKPGIAVYLDVSLQKYPTVYPACGDSHSAIELSCAELERFSRSSGWVDVCKPSG
ncbi:MAG: YbaK/EbsC family protein [Victivallales bacterium]|nr:YbaK/EbsC family protein [Victivallales bacterium]